MGPSIPEKWPSGLKTTLRVLKVVGIVSGGIAAVAAPWVAIYADVKPDAVEAKESARASLEAMVPAVVELQTLVGDGQEWANGTDERLASFEDNHTDLDRRLIRCEVYMEMLGRRRDFPAPPKPEPSSDDMSSTFSGSTSVTVSSEASSVQHHAPKYKVPTSIKKAKETASKRRAKKCLPSDPLCGAL